MTGPPALVIILARANSPVLVLASVCVWSVGVDETSMLTEPRGSLWVGLTSRQNSSIEKHKNSKKKKGLQRTLQGMSSPAHNPGHTFFFQQLQHFLDDDGDREEDGREEEDDRGNRRLC